MFIFGRTAAFRAAHEQLQNDMKLFSTQMKQSVDDVIARTPLKVKPRKSKVDLDAETPGTESLPPPLIPLAPGNSSRQSNATADQNAAFVVDENNGLLDLSQTATVQNN